MDTQTQAFLNLVSVVMKQNMTIIAQNTSVIHIVRRLVMDISALNQAVADLGTTLDTTTADFDSAISTLETHQSTIQTALDAADASLTQLQTNGRPEDQALIAQLQQQLAQAGNVDITTQIQALKDANTKLAGLDSSIKQAVAAPAPSGQPTDPAATPPVGS